MDEPLSLDLLKDTNATLLGGFVFGGVQLRTCGAHAGTHKFFDPSGGCLEKVMRELIIMSQDILSRPKLSPWFKAAWHTILLAYILSDGNGRLCRLLVNWILVRYGFAFMMDIPAHAVCNAISTGVAVQANQL